MALTRPRLLRIILVLSLALNLFVVGVIAADAITHRGWTASMLGLHHRSRSLMGLPNPRELRAALPDRDRAILNEMMAAHRPQFRERVKAVIAARLAVAEAVKAEPFDEARLRAAFDELVARHRAIVASAQDMVIELVGRLDPEGRAEFARLLAERRKHRHHPPDAQQK